MAPRWRPVIASDGPSRVVSDSGRVIIIPLRCGRSRVGRGDSIRWSAQAARGLAAQLNKSPEPLCLEMA